MATLTMLYGYTYHIITSESIMLSYHLEASEPEPQMHTLRGGPKGVQVGAWASAHLPIISLLISTIV